jgi:tungstate transport system substrate-binding protein
MRLATVLLISLVAGIGCRESAQRRQTMTLATTTSMRDSGLLDALLPTFRQQTGVEVRVIAVGTGQALALGRRGDADVLLTHAPAAEQEFMDGGFGSVRFPVMHNDFVLVGPELDPAQVTGETLTTEVFRRIAENQSPLVSRGDDSGTHKKELLVWQQARIEPRGAWYIQAGAGMAPTLRLASEKQAYTLTDRGTFLAQRDGLDLEILVAGDSLLRNQYAVILVNPQKHRHVAHEAAQDFARFLLAPETQAAIAEFGVEKYGTRLYIPELGPPAPKGQGSTHE